MKRWTPLLTHHWRAKLVAVLLATLIWFLLQRAIPEPLPVAPSSRAGTPGG